MGGSVQLLGLFDAGKTFVDGFDAVNNTVSTFTSIPAQFKCLLKKIDRKPTRFYTPLVVGLEELSMRHIELYVSESVGFQGRNLEQF